MKSFNKYKILVLLLFILMTKNSIAQLDYNLMDNWAFHPSKSGTLIDGYNLDIAVIDENLDTDTLFSITNNSMTNTGVDVFFVHPTILSDLWGYTDRVNIPLVDQPTFLISASILGQAGLLSKYGRFFAPRYRQASPPTYLGSPLDSTQAAIIGEAYNDIKTSFLHYLNNYNNGNKIILASHSQGAYLSAMLLRDVFDNDPDLQNKLVTAVIAGVVSAYSEPFQFTGGWWENIPLCTETNQCNCVMTWRSYKEGQSIPLVQASIPSLNPYLEDSDFVYRLLNVNEDWTLQDSIYYSNQPNPLRNYLVSKTDQQYGGNVGFLAFDSLYQIRYQRDGLRKVGFMVEHTPKPNEQRPDILLEEESNPLFNVLGYHFKDYAIYMWALLEQIDMKLESCGVTTGLNEPIYNNPFVQLFPNPCNNILNIKSDKSISRIKIFNNQGQLIKTENNTFYQYQITNSIGQVLQNGKLAGNNIDVSRLPKGIYFIQIKTEYGAIITRKFIKQ